MTNYLTLRFEAGADLPYTVEVGGTWLAHAAQRTGINVEAKLLLFTHTVRDLGRGPGGPEDRRPQRALPECHRGGGRDVRGDPAQLAAVHAKGERGQLRDSAMHSVVAADWPDVRARLQARLRV